MPSTRTQIKDQDNPTLLLRGNLIHLLQGHLTLLRLGNHTHRLLGNLTLLHLSNPTLLPLGHLTHLRLGSLDAEILVDTRQLLHAAVEQHKVVHQLNQPVLPAHAEQILIELETAVVGFVFLPLQEIFLRRADAAVLQTF